MVTDIRPRTLDWRSATTLHDLGDLTARYLSGEADESPAYLGLPDDETAEILEPLLTLNRGGFVTEMSQPGGFGPGWEQRAAVCGYCSAGLAKEIRRVCTMLGLGVIVTPPSRRPKRRTRFATQIPVTMSDGEEFTQIGAVASVRDLRDIWEDELSDAGMAALLDAHEVAVYDPMWGESTMLWTALMASIQQVKTRELSPVQVLEGVGRDKVVIGAVDLGAPGSGAVY